MRRSTRRAAALVATLLSAGCGRGDGDAGAPADTTSSPPGLIVPDDRIGPVTRATSEADLLGAFGDSPLAGNEIYLADCVCTEGTTLHPGTADRLEITRADSARTHPATLRTDSIGARWHTADGIRVGTTLE